MGALLMKLIGFILALLVTAASASYSPSTIQLIGASNGANASNSATNYIAVQGQTTPNATEVNVGVAMPPLRIYRMDCITGAVPGGVATWTITYRSGGVDSDCACVVTSAATSCSDTTCTTTSAAGTTSFKIVPATLPTATIVRCALQAQVR